MSTKTDIAVLGAAGAAALFIYMNRDAIGKWLNGGVSVSTTTTTTPYTGQAPTSNLPWHQATDLVTVNTLNNTITTGPQPGQNIDTTVIHAVSTPGILQQLINGNANTGGVDYNVVPGGSIVMPNGTTYTWGTAGLSQLPANSTTLPGVTNIATQNHVSGLDVIGGIGSSLSSIGMAAISPALYAYNFIGGLFA